MSTEIHGRHQHEKKHSHTKQILFSFLVLLILISGTAAAILYGTGYRLGFQQGKPKVAKTGILALSSSPKGAQVYLDNHLTTATDNSINLTPGEYTIKITKDGYFPWEKKVLIEEKVVTQITAFLISTNPRLEAVTSLGVKNPVIDPTNTKIAFTTDSQTFKKNGIYVLDMGANLMLPIRSNARQIVDETFDTFSLANLSWSPDSQAILASFAATTSREETTYLLDSQSFTELPQDISATLPSTLEEWEKITTQKNKTLNDSIKKPVQKIISDNFEVISYSPDENKILYKAKQNTELPIIIKPRRVGATNTLKEDREIKKDIIYVYNIKEDVNTKLFDSIESDCKTNSFCSLPISWMPDSERFVFVENKQIFLIDYDGSNKTTVYAGPFVDHYAFPWPDGTRLVILTNLNNPSTSANLYTISLK